MTTAEALAVVRNYIRNSIPTQPVHGFPGADANDVLALIEERVGELEAFRLRGNARRLAEAEAERDEARQAVLEYENCITWDTTCKNCASLMDTNYAQYVRISELEAALRDLLNEGIDDIDPRLRYVMMQVGRETLAAARRALGGGE